MCPCRLYYVHSSNGRYFRGILLYGPPGGGKTHLARALTGEMGVPVFTIRGPEVFTAYVGASESMLKGVFASAGAVAPAIVLIDEIDAMCPKRSDASEVEGRVVATLLTLMDGIRGSEAIVVLATTSRVGTLDPALRRAGRFDRCAQYWCIACCHVGLQG